MLSTATFRSNSARSVLPVPTPNPPSLFSLLLFLSRCTFFPFAFPFLQFYPVRCVALSIGTFPFVTHPFDSLSCVSFPLVTLPFVSLSFCTFALLTLPFVSLSFVTSPVDASVLTLSIPFLFHVYPSVAHTSTFRSCHLPSPTRYPLLPPSVIFIPGGRPPIICGWRARNCHP